MNIEKISLIISFVGIVMLIFLSQTLEPKEMKIYDINSKMLEGYVKIVGNLTDIKNLENMQILTVNDPTESIKVVVYEKTNLSKGMKIEVIGKVVRYKSSIEIEAQKIKQI